MTDASMITYETAKAAFHDAFRRRVGMGRGKISKADLVDAIEVTPSVVKSWFDGASMPQHAQMMKLYAWFGPDFTSEVLHPAGLGGVEEIAEVEVNAHQALADLAREASNISQRIIDGKFCHMDRAATGPELIKLAAVLESQGKAMLREGK